MDERGISTEDLVNLILDGSIIEDYPDSKPGASGRSTPGGAGHCGGWLVADVTLSAEKLTSNTIMKCHFCTTFLKHNDLST